MTTRSFRRPRVLPALVTLAFVLTTVPMFFSIYRDMAFDTSPHDDYAAALLAMTGELGAPPKRQLTVLGGAPIGYRLLSVAPALPLYRVLPYYPFSNLPDPDEHYLRAVAALALVSYVCILLTVLVIYLIARRRLRANPAASLLTAVLSFGLFRSMGIGGIGIDALAVLVISALCYWINRPAIVVPLIILTALINDKIPIIFGALFGTRFVASVVADRARGFRYWPQLLATLVSVLVYVGMRLILRLPGNENQTDPGTWLTGAAATIGATLSLKGLVLNGLPLVVMAVLMTIAVWAGRRRPGSFTVADLAVIPALIVVGLAIDVQHNLGRLALHGFPLYLPYLALFLDEHLARAEPAPPSDRSTGPVDLAAA
jgi:hypothetical protein